MRPGQNAHYLLAIVPVVLAGCAQIVGIGDWANGSGSGSSTTGSGGAGGAASASTGSPASTATSGGGASSTSTSNVSASATSATSSVAVGVAAATTTGSGCMIDGTACGTNTNCCNGHCVEGVCCNAACTQTCMSCLHQFHAAFVTGICANIDAGAARAGECPTTCSNTTFSIGGNCNGNGACANTSNDCFPYRCNPATGACYSGTCTSSGSPTFSGPQCAPSPTACCFTDTGPICTGCGQAGGPCSKNSDCHSLSCVMGMCA